MPRDSLTLNQWVDVTTSVLPKDFYQLKAVETKVGCPGLASQDDSLGITESNTKVRGSPKPVRPIPMTTLPRTSHKQEISGGSTLAVVTIDGIPLDSKEGR